MTRGAVSDRPAEMRLNARHLLFVYGTLKRGYTNWQRYLGVAESHQAAHYLGSAVTLDTFPMVVRPADWPGSSTRAPVLMDQPGTGSTICGEVFRVDDRCLEAMDILEGVKSGMYFKRTLQVRMLGDDDEAQPPAKRGKAGADGEEWLCGQTLSCTAYFFPASADLLRLPVRRTPLVPPQRSGAAPA